MHKAIFENSILPWIGKTGKLLFAFMAEKFRQRDIPLSVEQFVILKILHDGDGRPQNDLAVVTERHKASLTRLLDTMENKHLVARIPDPADKRVNRVHLTKHGRRSFEATLPVLAEAMQEIEQGLTEMEKTTLISILQKVQGNLFAGGVQEKSCSTN